MNITKTINLNGIAFVIDEDAYQMLYDYLQDIKLRLSKEDRQEVMKDVEARIAELFQQYCFAHRLDVVNSDLVRMVMNQLGNPDAFGENRRPKEGNTIKQSTGRKRILSITLKVLLAVVILPFAFPLLVVLLFLLMALFGMGIGVLNMVSSSPLMNVAFVLSAVAVAVVPLVIFIGCIVSYVRSHKGPGRKFWYTTLSVWVMSIVLTCVIAANFKWADQFNDFVHQLSNNIPSLRNTYTSERSVDAFHSLQVDGAIEVEIYQSDIPNISLCCDSTVESQLLTEVRDSVLYVSFLGEHTSMPTVTVLMPQLRSARCLGASRMTIFDQFTTDTLFLYSAGASFIRANMAVNHVHAEAAGSSRLNLEGEASSAKISLAGASKVESEWLRTNVMDIVSIGASKADVMVMDTLYAKVYGASEVVYIGDPLVVCSQTQDASYIKKK